MISLNYPLNVDREQKGNVGVRQTNSDVMSVCPPHTIRSPGTKVSEDESRLANRPKSTARLSIEHCRRRLNSCTTSEDQDWVNFVHGHPLYMLCKNGGGLSVKLNWFLSGILTCSWSDLSRHFAE